MGEKPMNSFTNIGDRIRQARENMGITKKEVARRLCMAYTTYNGYETGARQPRIGTLASIAKTLCVDLDYFVFQSIPSDTKPQNERSLLSMNVEINIADVEPIKSVLDIVMEMVNDDRVPMEYKARIAKELMGSMKTGGDTP